MPWHNKVPGYPTHSLIASSGRGSYYSLFASLDTSTMEKNLNLVEHLKNNGNF